MLENIQNNSVILLLFVFILDVVAMYVIRACISYPGTFWIPLKPENDVFSSRQTASVLQISFVQLQMDTSLPSTEWVLSLESRVAVIIKLKLQQHVSRQANFCWNNLPSDFKQLDVLYSRWRRFYLDIDITAQRELFTALTTSILAYLLAYLFIYLIVDRDK